MSTKLHLSILKDYTVIIPTVGRPILRECLGAIVKGQVKPGHIIVIDQGNNHEVDSWLHDINSLGIEVLHVRSNGRSPSSARNEGMEHVQTSFVVAVDDDCIAEIDWLQKMAECLHEIPEGIVTGRVEAAGDGIPQTVITSMASSLMKRLSIQNLSPLATGNMGVSREIAMRIGSFDENLFTAEDTDWAYRALQMGIPILYTPDVVVYHHHWRDRSQSTANYQEYAKGLGAFYGKHLRQGDWSMILRALLAFVRGVKSLIQGLIKKDPDLFQNGYARLTMLVPSLVNRFLSPINEGYKN